MQFITKQYTAQKRWNQFWNEESKHVTLHRICFQNQMTSYIWIILVFQKLYKSRMALIPKCTHTGNIVWRIYLLTPYLSTPHLMSLCMASKTFSLGWLQEKSPRTPIPASRGQRRLTTCMHVWFLSSSSGLQEKVSQFYTWPEPPNIMPPLYKWNILECTVKTKKIKLL